MVQFVSDNVLAMKLKTLSLRMPIINGDRWVASDDGQLLVHEAIDGMVLKNMETGQTLRTFLHELYQLIGIINNLYVAIQDLQALKVFNVYTGEACAEMAVRPGIVDAVCLCGDTFLALRTITDGVEIMDSKGTSDIIRLHHPYHVCTAADGHRAVALRKIVDITINVICLETRTVLHVVHASQRLQSASVQSHYLMVHEEYGVAITDLRTKRAVGQGTADNYARSWLSSCGRLVWTFDNRKLEFELTHWATRQRIGKLELYGDIDRPTQQGSTWSYQSIQDLTDGQHCVNTLPSSYYLTPVTMAYAMSRRGREREDIRVILGVLSKHKLPPELQHMITCLLFQSDIF